MENTLDLFAIVELFGHQKIAGKVSEQTVGSSTFVRIDVPETQHQVKFTKLVNPTAIYSINPTTEEVMLHMASTLGAKPIDAYDVRALQKKLLELGPGNELCR